MQAKKMQERKQMDFLSEGRYFFPLLKQKKGERVCRVQADVQFSDEIYSSLPFTGPNFLHKVGSKPFMRAKRNRMRMKNKKNGRQENVISRAYRKDDLEEKCWTLWCSSGKKLCSGHRLSPWSGQIPHAAGHLSPCTTITEPYVPRTRALQQETPPQ